MNIFKKLQLMMHRWFGHGRSSWYTMNVPCKECGYDGTYDFYTRSRAGETIAKIQKKRYGCPQDHKTAKEFIDSL